MPYALLAICEGNPPVTGGFHSQRTSNTALMFPLMMRCTSCCLNGQVTGALRRHDAHVASL